MYLSHEANLESYYREYLPNFIQQHLVADNVKAGAGHRLHYRYAINPQAKAWVIVLQGRAESAEKYAELIDELYQNGFSVFTFDHAGQGYSGRFNQNRMHGYIDSFDTYVDDAHDLISIHLAAVKGQHRQAHLPQFLLCHSMGSAIGTLLLIKHPQLCSHAVFCSPMYGIKAPIPLMLARIMINVGLRMSQFLGRKSLYFLGQGDYKSTAFDKNHLTSSPQRYAWFKEYYDTNGDASIGGASVQWLAAALTAMHNIEQNAHSLSHPALVFRAGDDHIVDNKAIASVVSSMQNAQMIDIEGAQHEILFERDIYRQQAIKAIHSFFERALVSQTDKRELTDA
ncbi:alpha/beta fold hydrolase [Ningiella sp. W23]|uniref:alpha/beta fold hydrolase n=1 Tax=Ningiella sp. W23 TaxID=3023715 RepID=UPI003756D7F2